MVEIFLLTWIAREQSPAFPTAGVKVNVNLIVLFHSMINMVVSDM